MPGGGVGPEIGGLWPAPWQVNCLGIMPPVKTGLVTDMVSGASAVSGFGLPSSPHPPSSRLPATQAGQPPSLPSRSRPPIAPRRTLPHPVLCSAAVPLVHGGHAAEPAPHRLSGRWQSYGGMPPLITPDLGQAVQIAGAQSGWRDVPNMISSQEGTEARRDLPLAAFLAAPAAASADSGAARRARRRRLGRTLGQGRRRDRQRPWPDRRGLRARGFVSRTPRSRRPMAAAARRPPGAPARAPDRRTGRAAGTRSA